MPDKSPEIYLITILGVILGILLVSFIVAMVILSKRRQQLQQQEVSKMKDQFEKELLQSQLEIQEHTFKNISQELHDNIGQMLSVVKLTLSALPVESDHKAKPLINHSQQVLNKAIFDLSDLTKSLHTDRITELGMVELVRFELASIKNTGLINVQFDVKGTEFQLEGQKGIFLFRMFQEMMNNMLKHAKATQVNVQLDYQPGNIFVMRIQDNGVGFDLEGTRNTISSSKGVGLKSLFNRAKLIGADMDMKSTVGKGTSVTITVLPELNQ